MVSLMITLIVVIMNLVNFFNFNVLKALKVMNYGNIFLFATTIIAYYLGFTYYVVYFSAILFAIFNFAQFSYYYALPTNFNYSINIRNGTYVILAYELGFFFVSLSGYLMDIFHPIALHIFMLLLSVITLILYENTLYMLKENI